MPRPTIEWLTVGTRADATVQKINHHNDVSAACRAIPMMLRAGDRREFIHVATLVRRTAPDGTVATWVPCGDGGWFRDAMGMPVTRVSPTLVRQFIAYFY